MITFYWYDIVRISRCFVLFLRMPDPLSCLYTASERENGFLKMKSGETFTMECKTVDNTIDNLRLYVRLPIKHLVVLYDNNTNEFTISMAYTKRVKISGHLNKLTISISDMQLDDSGLYIGWYSKYDLSKSQELEEEGCSTLLFVNGKNAFVFRICIFGICIFEHYRTHKVWDKCMILSRFSFCSIIKWG